MTADLAPFPECDTALRLATIPGLSQISSSTIGDRLSATFDYQHDSTILRLPENLGCITIHGSGPASRMLAILVARALPHLALRLSDIDYNFDLPLDPQATHRTLRDSIDTFG